jgi:gliding motility-associated-like protein
VFIKDANNCFSKLGDILIKAIDCSYEYVFSPDKGEVWKIPTKESAGEIKIFNKQGKLVYSAEFDMPGDYEWDGRTNSGGELPMGAYLFVLKLRDNETLKGNVTIVR